MCIFHFPTCKFISNSYNFVLALVLMRAQKLFKNIAREIALLDVDENKLKGEMMDLQHGRTHSRNCVVKAGTGNCINIVTSFNNFNYNYRLCYFGWIEGLHSNSW